MTPTELNDIQIRNGLTNKALADKLTISLSLVEKWRTGKRPIRPVYAHLLRVLYGEKPNRR